MPIDPFWLRLVRGREFQGNKALYPLAGRSGAVVEDETCEDFAKIYRRYKLIDGKAAGAEFFARIDELLDVLCRNFIDPIAEQAKLTSPSSPDDPGDTHPNIAALVRRMTTLYEIEDYPGVLHASASIFETMAIDIVGLETVTRQSLGGFFDRYRKDSRLPDHILDYILDVYRNRNKTPLAGHGSLNTAALTAEDALTLIEMTKTLVRVEYKLRDD